MHQHRLRGGDLYCRVPPDVGLAPSPAGGPPLQPPLHPRTPPPTPDWAAPSRSIAKRGKGGGGKREGEGGEGRALGPPIARGDGGGPSKHQLGPDPHLGGSQYCTPQKLSDFMPQVARYPCDQILLGQKSCRTKVSRIFRTFVPNFAPNFAPNFPEVFEDFSCFVSWETETRKNAPKIPAIFQRKISQANTKKIFTKFFCRAGRVKYRK